MGRGETGCRAALKADTVEAEALNLADTCEGPCWPLDVVTEWKIHVVQTARSMRAPAWADSMMGKSKMPRNALAMQLLLRYP
ncbi:hypothetical protein NDU88_003808 [Pleurodeles waltl]|uniref:Uncharacterized protein n=1 Tax=Pleurodeles waltl TaxID=8319 RepID=A0AAV7REY1_PLEWA|nr:hypothetical protein NDU88_003808 [Pleurodeles waltl]